MYSILPAAPSSTTPQQTIRRSTDNRARPSFEQSPYPPPSSPLPPVPKSTLPPQQKIPTSPQYLPPTPDSLRPVPQSSRRKHSPNRDLADFHRELGRPSHCPTSPDRDHPASSCRPPSSKHSTSVAPSRLSGQISRRSSQPMEHSDSAMNTSILSTSSTSSLSLAKPPVLSQTTTLAPAPRPAPAAARYRRPHTVYFHGGIGGAGNYRKVIRENNRAPRAYAENAEPLRRASPTRFLSSLFGSQRGGKGHHSGNGNGRGSPDDMGRGSEDSMREEVSLGAAEVLRRKMVGGAWRKKGSS